MQNFLTILAIFSASTAFADFSIKCNKHGAVMTTTDGATYYLGKTCEAAKKAGGTGRWWYAASAFIVEIDGESIRYPFEIDCDVPYCKP
ncbi:MAG: hypothetical protein WBC93_16540 [Sulfitobacter sp.]